jgi:ribosomal protein S18 acetylase RimI-like enzyme
VTHADLGHFEALLLESDRRYFELAARPHHVYGACISFVEGLTTAPGAAVVPRVDVPVAASDPGRWLTEIEAAFARSCAGMVRVYLDRQPPELVAALRDRRYEHRLELGFLAEKALPGGADNVTLHGVDGSVASEVAEAMGQGLHEPPDGHATSAEDRVALQERRSETTAFDWFVGRDRDGTVVGTIGALRVSDLVRAKDVWVAPHARRRGVASAMLTRLQRELVGPNERLGIFAVEGTAGMHLYRSLGMRPVVEWHEWSRATPAVRSVRSR